MRKRPLRELISVEFVDDIDAIIRFRHDRTSFTYKGARNCWERISESGTHVSFPMPNTIKYLENVWNNSRKFK